MQKIVFTNGCFDIIHAGHIGYLQCARQLGDVLVVAVNSDESISRLKGPSRPVNTLADRMAVLAELRCVDVVLSFDDDTPENIIKVVRPHVLVKGGDYEGQDIIGADFVRSIGGKVEILPLFEGRSTTKVIRKIQSAT